MARRWSRTSARRSSRSGAAAGGDVGVWSGGGATTGGEGCVSTRVSPDNHESASESRLLFVNLRTAWTASTESMSGDSDSVDMHDVQVGGVPFQMFVLCRRWLAGSRGGCPGRGRCWGRYARNRGCDARRRRRPAMFSSFLGLPLLQLERRTLSTRGTRRRSL